MILRKKATIKKASPNTRRPLLVVYLMLSSLLVCPNISEAGFLGTLIEDILTLGNSRKQREERRQAERREHERRKAQEKLRKTKVLGKIKNIKIQIESLKEQEILLEEQIRNRKGDIDAWRESANKYEASIREVLDFFLNPEMLVLHTLNYKDYFGGIIRDLPHYIDRLENLVDNHMAEELDDSQLKALRLLLEKLKEAQGKRQKEIYQTIMLNPSNIDEENKNQKILSIVSITRAVHIFKIKKNDLLNRAKSKELDSKENILPKLQTIKEKIRRLGEQKKALAKAL